MPRRLPLLCVLALLPLLLLWPLPMVGASDVLAAPTQEASTHIWGLWAALHTGQPLVVRTDLLVWPDGVEIVLVDPANLPWFAVGGLLGPAAAYSTVLYAGLVLAGLAGALLSARLGGAPWLGAALAMASPTLLSSAADGMTEDFAVGWVGIHIALLLRFRDRGGWGWGAGAAAALVAAWYGGPYNGVWAVGADLVIGMHALVRARRTGWPPVARLLAVGAAAAVACAPLFSAILGMRQDQLPGSAARAGLPRIVEDPRFFRGGIQTGADLLDAWLPGPLTGHEADLSHTAYLGVVVLVLAGFSVYRDRQRLPWLLGAAAFSLLALGPWLYVAGRVPEVGGHSVMAPAGWLTLALPLLGRMTRWYRANAVATLLLAPLAAAAMGTGRRLRTARLVVAVLVLADVLLLAPLAWPLHHMALPDASPYALLQGEGALLEVPPATTGEPPPGHWRDRVGLVQPFHQRPVGGAMMNLRPSDDALVGRTAMSELLRTRRFPDRTRRRLLDAGFRWVAFYPGYLPMPAGSEHALERCLGRAVYRDDEIWLYRLDGADTAPDCTTK